MPDSRYSWVNKNMTLEECKVKCLKNCSCVAYTQLDISIKGSGCLFWSEELNDIRDLSVDGQDIYIRMASSELDSKGTRRKILISSMTSLMGMVLLGLCLMLYYWKRKKNYANGIIGGHNKDFELPLFDLSTVSRATNNFSTNNKLGQGGYGPVYKGVLENGQEIAVKRLPKTSMQGIIEFKNEVICIAKLQHRNLVKLLGYCIQGEEKMLIYEYMPNKSLDFFLFDETRSKLLDWPKRLKVVNGVARGLMYIHQDSQLRIIHRDLKASNILLDTDMKPKISDFGIAKCFQEHETEDKTSRVVGTYGYMSPEYAVHGQFSAKSDVFSFGVLVLEIVSGKRNSGFSREDQHLNLLGHAWTLYKGGRSLELIDPFLLDLANPSEVLRLIHVGLLCVQQCPDDRPSMASVVAMLDNEVILPPANQPGFFTERDVFVVKSTTSSSFNEVTITQLEAR
ncbi:G-type lectin S-receptor-like serine threonine-kinase At4g27290 isoform X1 [Olea europaea subsp. europaea]|uniref:non-specific serine/threonine protein kinase n=1 Tax=Olea europaea subsp. europaea TaxID=158383 RepID=A0A8S0SJL4_OLEEU|nr:G-type lectin S-receptor-like serine threonine-kinase At4g27290 isoform X1 [Olea europaea subsp. europaea]